MPTNKAWVIEKKCLPHFLSFHMYYCQPNFQVLMRISWASFWYFQQLEIQRIWSEQDCKRTAQKMWIWKQSPRINTRKQLQCDFKIEVLSVWSGTFFFTDSRYVYYPLRNSMQKECTELILKLLHFRILSSIQCTAPFFGQNLS